MSYASQPIPYPARYDYGSRRSYPTLAFVVHMAEGKDVAQYLSRKPARGVSVHYTIEQRTKRWKDGEVVRCLPEGRISGSLNPDTIRTTDDPDGYYGASYAKAALGRYWTNPNVAVVSIEIAGRAVDGPTPAQVESLLALFREVDRRYSADVDPLGHRDFQNVKRCPGKSPALVDAFAQMGRGKGGDYVSTRHFAPGQVCDVRDDAKLYDYPGGPVIGTIDPPLTRDFLGYSPKGGDYALVATDLSTGRTAWVRASSVANVRVETPAGCESERAAGRVAGLEEAEAAVAALPR